MWETVTQGKGGALASLRTGAWHEAVAFCSWSDTPPSAPEDDGERGIERPQLDPAERSRWRDGRGAYPVVGVGHSDQYPEAHGGHLRQCDQRDNA